MIVLLFARTLYFSLQYSCICLMNDHVYCIWKMISQNVINHNILIIWFHIVNKQSHTETVKSARTELQRVQHPYTEILHCLICVAAIYWRLLFGQVKFCQLAVYWVCVNFFFISARYWSFIYIFSFFSSFIIFNCCLRWLFKKDHPLLSGPGNEDTGSLFIVTSLGVTSLPWVNVKNKRRLLLDISYLVHWMFCYHFEYFACCFSQFWHAYCT